MCCVQVFVPSKDGTKVPMFITYKKGIKLDGSNPTLLYGYGEQPTEAAHGPVANIYACMPHVCTVDSHLNLQLPVLVMHTYE